MTAVLKRPFEMDSARVGCREGVVEVPSKRLREEHPSSIQAPSSSFAQDNVVLPRRGSTTKYKSNTCIDSTNFTQTNRSTPLNIVIPIGGIGSRFQTEKFRFPKPLINIVGRPMLCWVLEWLVLGEGDTVWLAINEAVDDEYRVAETLRKEFPSIDLRLLRLKYLTSGAAETLYIVTQSMNSIERSRRTVSLDCDTIYFGDILSQIRALPTSSGACVYFTDTGHLPIFSYLSTVRAPAETGRDSVSATDSEKTPPEVIVDIQEKNAISRKANTGAYVFPSADLLRRWAQEALDNPSPGDELYTSRLISNMISTKQVQFQALHIDEADFACVGTPKQLQAFLSRIKMEPHLVKKKRRFCFDLDMTLVGAPTIPGRYDTCLPIEKNIKLVRELKAAGHTVIIHTARRMKTHSGNVGAVIADIGITTIRSLQEHDIPYDEIYFGKPYADVYIDDLAVNANLDTYKEIGWTIHSDGTAVGNGNKLSDAKEANKVGIVASRNFNVIQIVGDRIVKTSESYALLGEIFFYSHIPRALEDLFPTCYSVNAVSNEDEENKKKTLSITMEKLAGVTFSHLLVGRSLTLGKLRSFLRALTRIHRCDGLLPSPSPSVAIGDSLLGLLEKKTSSTSTAVSIYSNYNTKVTERFQSFRVEYTTLDPDAAETYETIAEKLRKYEDANHGTPTAVIHGDPVFSNAIAGTDGSVKFIDVRCCLGEMLTPEGDLLYDLAKVLQSLQGYDHVLLSSVSQRTAANGIKDIIDDRDKELLTHLQDVFWAYVEDTYPAVKRDDVTVLTASLLFSLIPLHEESFRPLFYELCRNLLESGTGWSN